MFYCGPMKVEKLKKCNVSNAGIAHMTNSLHLSEWRNYIRAQRKVNLCAPGAPKGPKVGMFVRQYEIVCANDAGRAPRKYPAILVVCCRHRHHTGYLFQPLMTNMHHKED